jgi:Arc/MetJ family transcription regulator
MRTNVVINDDLLREAMSLTGVRTKRALIEEALRTLIEVRTRQKRVRSYRDRARQIEDKLAGLSLRQSPAQVLREDRDRR